MAKGFDRIAMISDLDIWRAANLLIRKHRGEAELAAARRTDLMLDRGDLEGQAVWKRIRRAIVELQAPPTGPANRSEGGYSEADPGVASFGMRVRPRALTRARPGAIDLDFGECSPQPFLALLPDPISLGLGIWTCRSVEQPEAREHREIAEPIEKPSQAGLLEHTREISADGRRCRGTRGS